MFPHVGTQRGSSQGCPGKEKGRAPENQVYHSATPNGPRWSRKGCGGCCSHCCGHHLLPIGNHRDTHSLPGLGRKQSALFLPALMLLYGYDTFSCGTGSCCLVVPHCRGNSAQRETCPVRDLSWSAW